MIAHRILAWHFTTPPWPEASAPGNSNRSTPEFASFAALIELAFLNAHAEIFRQEFQGNVVRIRCYLPRHLLHHIEGPTVKVRWLREAQPSANGVHKANGELL